MLKVIELFAGVGSQTQALKNIGVEHEVIGISEIDKYAINSYMQIHGETPNFGDISKIDKLPQVDLWIYSFPCQDISTAGKMKGINKETRSGLLYEVERLLNVSEKPKYLLMENVKNLVGKKFKPDFDKWCEKLEELGYTNYWQVLNAKDYGVPQNRERVFMVSVLEEHEPYAFPPKEKLELRLKDILEDEVDKKYYMKRTLLKKIINFNENNDKILCCGKLKMKGHDISKRVYSTDGVSPNINARSETAKVIVKGNISPKGFRSMDILGINGIAKTLMANGGGNTEPKVLVKEATKKGYKEAYVGDNINLEQPNSKTRRGRVGNQIANTLVTNCNQATVTENYRIRKLTPRECWRLMGWKDEQFDKIKGTSNSQLYKQAGNGIVVPVLEKIFTNLFKN